MAYRQRSQGAITGTPGRRHSDIFPQYQGLFASLEARPDLDPLRPAVFELAVGHFLSTVDNPRRVPPRTPNPVGGLREPFELPPDRDWSATCVARYYRVEKVVRPAGGG